VISQSSGKPCRKMASWNGKRLRGFETSKSHIETKDIKGNKCNLRLNCLDAVHAMDAMVKYR